MSEKPVLEARNVTVTFGGFKALTDVSLAVEPGKVHGLIGPNGAGKTTMINVLTGFQVPTLGDVKCNGERVGHLPAYELRRRGIARTFQAGRLFKGLSVLDNLAITGVGLGHSRRSSEIEAGRILDHMDITSLGSQITEGLPYTDERRVGIARALMFSPNFLLLDEPAAGMSEVEARELSKLIGMICNDFGTGVLLIEHNVELVLSLSAHIYVLDAGQLIEEGSRDVISTSKRVRDAYFGADQEVA